MTYEPNYLVHYGVKGQKHGLRRYQNEDGSLTVEGREHYGIGNGRQGGGAKARFLGLFKKQTPEEKERYKRGKEYAKERDRLADEKRKQLLEKDKEYQLAKKESDDADDEYARATDEEGRVNAAYRQGKAAAETDRLYNRASDRATKHANDVITKKYGDNAMSDVEHYKTESKKKFNRFVGGTLAALSVAAIGIGILDSRNRSKNR